ncbi:ArsR/SmtB family transcription factor [Gordonia sp. (in: high G+C Gram-positive bacteria)]|uniref:ArsR/SmtB family transcription factor n=1 Tax=Gordonia sp. (in: high G+C Gram-positive bacteria) TaxID=84139 RepID=UPI003F9B5DA3
MTTADAGVADLHTVLNALADPVRLEMARRLHDAGQSLACTALYDTVGKATASHHFKILREAGIIERHAAGQGAMFSLRDTDVEATYPGLLTAVLSAANPLLAP